VIGVIERDILVEKERVRLQVVVRLGFFVFLERRLAFPSEREGPRFGGGGDLPPATGPEWMAVRLH